MNLKRRKRRRRKMERSASESNHQTKVAASLLIGSFSSFLFLSHFDNQHTTTDGMAHCILRTMGQRIAKKNIAGKERERATAKWTRTSSRTTLILPDDSDSSHLHLTGLLTVIFGGRGAIDCATHFTANNGQVKITHTIIANQKNTSACLCLCPSKLSLSLSFPL